MCQHQTFVFNIDETLNLLQMQVGNMTLRLRARSLIDSNVGSNLAVLVMILGKALCDNISIKKILKNRTVISWYLRKQVGVSLPYAQHLHCVPASQKDKQRTRYNKKQEQAIFFLMQHWDTKYLILIVAIIKKPSSLYFLKF